MSHARPSDPDPRQSPDLDSGGSPESGQTPAADSISMGSESEQMKQSPSPQATKKSAYIWIAVIILFIILMGVGVMGYAFEVF